MFSRVAVALFPSMKGVIRDFNFKQVSFTDKFNDTGAKLTKYVHHYTMDDGEIYDLAFEMTSTPKAEIGETVSFQFELDKEFRGRQDRKITRGTFTSVSDSQWATSPQATPTNGPLSSADLFVRHWALNTATLLLSGNLPLATEKRNKPKTLAMVSELAARIEQEINRARQGETKGPAPTAAVLRS